MSIKKMMTSPWIVLLLVGFAVFSVRQLTKEKPIPNHNADQMAAKPVNVIRAKPVQFRSRVIGYGYVEPTTELQIKAQVSGKVTYVDPGLRRGSGVRGDATVLRIEAADYQVSLKQSEADLASSQFNLNRIEEEEKSTQRSLALAQKNLAKGQQEYERIRSLFERGLVAQSALDAEEQKVIQLEQSVSDIQGQLNTFEDQKKSEAASIVRKEQSVKGGQTTLGRTEITMPFDGRIGEVFVSVGEFVSVGTPLFEVSDIEGVEINAQISAMDMYTLVSHLFGKDVSEQQMVEATQLRDLLNLEARVRLIGGPPVETVWPAKVLRMSESVDTTRRTLGIIVGIDDPYSKVAPGKRPPLLKGMYAAVELIAPAYEAWVLPRQAIHQGRVYTVGAENQLQIKPIKSLFSQNQLVVLAEPMALNERVIVNDITPVIEGIPLTPIPSMEEERALERRALGDTL